MCLLCANSTLSYAAAPASATMPLYGASGPNSSRTLTATGINNIDALLSGYAWSGSTITYSFPTLVSQYEAGITEPLAVGFAGATAALKTATRSAMAMVSQYTNLSTVEVSATTPADIRTAFSSAANDTAYAYIPGNNPEAGDVWYGTVYPEYRSPAKGEYGWATVLHEIGHALGLKHGFDGSDGLFPTALDAAKDQMAYSLMTYRSYQGANVTTGYTNEEGGYAQTYMMYDIAALQTMYGANFNTQSGNTTYRWSETTGEMSIDGIWQGAPLRNRIFMTVWDGNGEDTYDFSNYLSGITVDLAPGSFSTVSTVQVANLGMGFYAPGNIFNALQYNGDARSLIENAIGGGGNDTLAGNSANNALTGNSGNDTLRGLAGNDILEGGLAADVLDGGDGFDFTSYAGAGGGVTVNLSAPGVNTGEATGDTFTAIEGVIGSGFNDFIGGNAADNVLRGGGGIDGIWGDAGNDELDGGAGADYLHGGAGIDLASYATSASGLTVNLTAPAVNTGDAAGDTFVEIEGVIGSGFNDFLAGNTADNVLRGGGGIDGIWGDAGNDELDGGAGADYLHGGAGIDLASYATSASGLTVNLTAPAVNTGDAAGDILIEIEGIIGSGFNDFLAGNTGDNVLRGGGGIDGIWGDAGNDELDGGAGADYLHGGAGIDLASYATSASGLTVNLTAPAVNTGDAAGDILVEIEGIIGSGFNDFLAGNTADNVLRGGGGIDGIWGDAGNDELDGGAGADYLHGGAGIDLASYATATSGITVNLSTPAVNSGDAAGDILIEIEGVIGSGFTDFIGGNTADNVLRGGGGFDGIWGDAGNDELEGGTGADYLEGGAGQDRFVYRTASDGGDTIGDFSALDDTLVFHAAGFTGLTPGVDLVATGHLTFGTGAIGTVGQLIYNSATGALLWDVDGTGGIAATTLAMINTKPTLSSADFSIIG